MATVPRTLSIATARCHRLGVPDRPPALSFLDLLPATRLVPRGQPPLPLTVDDACSVVIQSAIAPAAPALGRTAASLAHALVEALSGRRSVAQLGRWFDDGALAAIADRARSERGSALKLASVRLQLTSAAVAEVTLRMTKGDRSTAAAARLEARAGRWVCQSVALGPG